MLKKKSPNIWPRLTECTLRRHWLRVDFDRLCPNPSDDDDLSDLFDSDSEEMTSTYRANSSSLAGMLGYGNDRKSIINWQNEPRSFVERMRLIYLVIFNLIQLFGYLIILSVFSLHYSRSGPSKTLY